MQQRLGGAPVLEISAAWPVALAAYGRMLLGVGFERTHAGERPLLDRCRGDVIHATRSELRLSAQVEQLAASITEWGFTIPILVDEDGVVLAGHGRLLAAALLRAA